MIRLFVFAALLGFPLVASAQGWSDRGGYSPTPRLETTDQARQRHDAERYRQYEQNNQRAPLGGYRDRLGDPAPMGVPAQGEP